MISQTGIRLVIGMFCSSCQEIRMAHVWGLRGDRMRSLRGEGNQGLSAGPRLCVLRPGQALCLLPEFYPMQPRPGPLGGPRLKAHGAPVRGGAVGREVGRNSALGGSASLGLPRGAVRCTPDLMGPHEGPHEGLCTLGG